MKVINYVHNFPIVGENHIKSKVFAARFPNPNHCKNRLSGKVLPEYHHVIPYIFVISLFETSHAAADFFFRDTLSKWSLAVCSSLEAYSSLLHSDKAKEKIPPPTNQKIFLVTLTNQLTF